MEQKSNPQEDLNHIRDIMERSSRFLSLSGLSGVLAGIYALIGAAAAFWVLNHNQLKPNYTRFQAQDNTTVIILIGIAVVVLGAALITGVLFSVRRARKIGVRLWGATSRRLFINLIIPLATGGIFVLLMTQKGYYGLSAPLMLIFYGLALINASKYTLPDIRSLGMAEIILGLINTAMIGYGLYFWAAGFGLLHIIYGIAMYLKYER